jgi:hypothetical protein
VKTQNQNIHKIQKQGNLYNFNIIIIIIHIKVVMKEELAGDGEKRCGSPAKPLKASRDSRY